MLITEAQRKRIPELYAQEEIADPMVYLIIRCMNSFWLITECNEDGLAFGWADMFGDGSCGELGYIHLDEIEGLQESYIVNVEEVETLLSELKAKFYR